MSATPLFDELLAAVRSGQDDHPTPVAALQKGAKGWEVEVNQIVGDRAHLERVIEMEVPPSEANDARLPPWLECLQHRATHFRHTKRLIGALFQTYLAKISGPRREALLTAVVRERSDRFIRAPWVQPSVCAFDFPTAFLADWFLTVLPTDGSGSEFWSVLEAFAVARPAAALEMLMTPALRQGDVARNVRVSVLGALRYLPDVPDEVSATVLAIVDALSRRLDPLERADGLRSLCTPLWRGAVPTADVVDAFAYLERLPAAERLIGFEYAGALCRSDTAAVEQKVIAVRWLKDHIAATSGLRDKINAIHAVWRAWKQLDPTMLGFDPVQLVVAVQPLNDDAKAWHSIEDLLSEVMETSPDRFQHWLTTLARDHGKAVRKAFEDRGPLAGLLTGLSHAEWAPEFVAELMAAEHSGERRLGFQLFESLRFAPTQAPATPVFTPLAFKIWRAEFQIARCYESVAAQLAWASRRLDLQSTGMVQAFQEEALYHCKNLPGLCLGRLRPLIGGMTIFAPVVAAADVYFEKLRSVQDSAIKAQQIPGLTRAIFRKIRADRRRLDEMVQKQSILSLLATKSYLLYGNRYSHWMGGKLSDASGLHEVSNSFEIPRLEVIHPENAFLRKLNALAFLGELKSKIEGVQREGEAK
jgi:hypothetical protein